MQTSKTVRKAARYASTYAVWIFASLVTLIPIYWMVIVSSRSRVELFDRPSFILRSFYEQNYLNVLNNAAFRSYVVNSIIVSTANALLVTTLALLATYALSRWRLPGSDDIFFWTITNRMAPPAVFLLPLFLLFTKTFRVGDWMLYDTRIGLILLYCVFNLPFAIWVLQGMIDGIPIELDEAAMVDGAGMGRILLRIIIPLAAPGLAITAILSWIFAWNEYLFAATLTSSTAARTITTGLAEFVTVTGTNWGEMAATATLTLIPSLVFISFVQRYIVLGLTFGAVKE